MTNQIAFTGVAQAGSALPLSGGPASAGLDLSSQPPSIDMSAASTYTDVNGLAALKREPDSPQALNAVAQQVEALFLQMMLKSMRDATAAESDDSNEMGMYQDMFDKQVALTLSEHADLGIAKLLKRQSALKSSTAAAVSRAAAGSDPAAGVAASGSAASAGAGVLGQTPEEFVHRVMPTIRRAAAALGINPLGLLAQAALETGWGQRMPRTADGSSSLNLFGIKAGDQWTGPRATADSMEVVNGVATPRRATFRAYRSVEDSVNDFANLLKGSPRYREAVAAGSDAQAYVAGIGRSGYATDPEYGDKLNQILNGGALQAALSPRSAAL
jgi:flagellar protein FlgJ